MKTNLLKKTLLVCFLSVFTAQTFAQSSEISQDVRNEIEQLNNSIEKAVVKKTLGDVAAMYSDNATILTPGGKKIHGRKEIADFWYEMANCKEFKSEITELGGNSKMIYQLGKWTVTTEKDGKLVTYSTDVVLVWKRDSGFDYKIQLNSLNNTVTLAEMPLPPNSAQVK